MQASIRASSAVRQPEVEIVPVETEETPWKPLYRAGGVAALLSVALIPIAALVFFLWPPPSFQPTSHAVLDWFTLLQSNLFRGLLGFDLLFLVGEALLVPVLLALYAALRRTSQGFMALALALGLIGVTLYFTANPVFSLLSLSNQYAAATAAERSQLVAAGQALLATYQGTPFDVAYILGAVATFIIALVMLRSPLFSNGTASVGIVMGVLMVVPATAGTPGIVLSLVSLVPTVIWDILIARRLFHLGQGSTKERHGSS